MAGAPEGRLLASILGHSLCLDLYGAPSKEETLAGAVTHGKVGVLPWQWKRPDSGTLEGECKDDLAQLQFSRRLQVKGNCVVIEERLQNLCAWDRPVGWQQHVSLGSPFCEEGFWAQSNCDLGSTHPQTFGAGSSLIPGRKTQWPTSATSERAAPATTVGRSKMTPPQTISAAFACGPQMNSAASSPETPISASHCFMFGLAISFPGWGCGTRSMLGT